MLTADRSAVAKKAEPARGRSYLFGQKKLSDSPQKALKKVMPKKEAKKVSRTASLVGPSLLAVLQTTPSGVLVRKASSLFCTGRLFAVFWVPSSQKASFSKENCLNIP